MESIEPKASQTETRAQPEARQPETSQLEAVPLCQTDPPVIENIVLLDHPPIVMVTETMWCGSTSRGDFYERISPLMSVHEEAPEATCREPAVELDEPAMMQLRPLVSSSAETIVYEPETAQPVLRAQPETAQPETAQPVLRAPCDDGEETAELSLGPPSVVGEELSEFQISSAPAHGGRAVMWSYCFYIVYSILFNILLICLTDIFEEISRSLDCEHNVDDIPSFMNTDNQVDYRECHVSDLPSFCDYKPRENEVSCWIQTPVHSRRPLEPGGSWRGW